MEISTWFGAPKKWNALFQWLDKYMYVTMHEQLALLTKETSIPWEFPSGDAPDWVK